MQVLLAVGVDDAEVEQSCVQCDAAVEPVGLVVALIEGLLPPVIVIPGGYRRRYLGRSLR